MFKILLEDHVASLHCFESDWVAHDIIIWLRDDGNEEVKKHDHHDEHVQYPDAPCIVNHHDCTVVAESCVLLPVRKTWIIRVSDWVSEHLDEIGELLV